MYLHSGVHVLVVVNGVLISRVQSGLKAVLQLLQWVWQNLSHGDGSFHMQSLSFIAKATLGLLKTYIRYTCIFPLISLH